MRLGQAARAVAIAFAILVMNYAAATAAIFAYSLLIAPGHDPSFYSERAPRIAGWIAPIAGALMFFIAGLRLRRTGAPAATAWAVLRIWAAYVILDLVSGLALGGGLSLLSGLMLLSVMAALAGGLAGGFLPVALSRKAQEA